MPEAEESGGEAQGSRFTRGRFGAVGCLATDCVSPPLSLSYCSTDSTQWRRRPCPIVGERLRVVARALRDGSIVSWEKGSWKTAERRFWASATPIETTADVSCRVCSVCRHFPTIGKKMKFPPPFKPPRRGEEILEELPYIIFILHTYTAY